jgi:phosphoribosylformylglycinamidine synthase
MAMAGGIGFVMNERDAPTTLPLHAFLFGEDGARYVVTCPSAGLYDLRREASEAGIPTWYLGMTGGSDMVLPGDAPIALDALRNAHESWLPDYMAGHTEDAPQGTPPEEPQAEAA